MSDQSDLLTQIDAQLSSLPDYAQLQIHVKKHADFGKAFSNADVVKITQFKYNQYEPNVACAQDVMHLMKGVTEAALTGAVTFSITFKKGKADQMQVQDFKKI